MRRFTGHSRDVRRVAFAPDGESVVTGSDDWSAGIWQVDYGRVIDLVCSQLRRDFTDEERRLYNIVDNTPTCPKP